MIEQIVSEILDKVGHVWFLDSGVIEPGEDDVRKMLDSAAKALYDCKQGDRFESGGLIIEKMTIGFNVYCYVGNYE